MPKRKLIKDTKESSNHEHGVFGRDRDSSGPIAALTFGRDTRRHGLVRVSDEKTYAPFTARSNRGIPLHAPSAASLLFRMRK